MTQLSRRNMLKLAALATGSQALGLHSLGALPAMAQTVSANDYKALVCIFLVGGNDSNNLLIPADPSSFQAYQTIRGALALPQENLLSLGSNASVMLNAAMPNLQNMYQAGTAALVTNVGPLVQNMTRAQYLSGSMPVPFALFSHRDQQIGWQSANPATETGLGWAGLAADQLGQNAGGSLPSVISVGGNPVFMYGQKTTGLSVLSTTTSFAPECGMPSNACAARIDAAQQLLSLDSGAMLIQADNTIASNAYGYFSDLSYAMKAAPSLKTIFPANPLATQLYQIAKIMSVRSSIGANRQIFFASFGSFDTHTGQLQAQTKLLGQLDSAIAAFQQAMEELNLSEQVTAFSMSDFSRAMVPNSAGGTDHAWGGHQFVLGGAVKGGRMYGSMPTMLLGGPDDSTNDGRWIPTISASQYTATLANWFGIPTANMASVVPNIGNFAIRNLGFV
ncbi:MAG: DUF1501 domain-containing protein [Edaphobacter sp.]|uniref:DUF1501 domain-containing protein n=1 Tax=Edaphobacter sp. TaxID=1934404 RepID=UPI0023954A01|nr:DUF1501 domain-containing protein [Edaphobacter sp.]MDE1178837.1 DUF1501 domain-containing protein [Edaphobacter sp.]